MGGRGRGAGLDWPVIDGDLVLVPTNGEGGGRWVALVRSSGREVWHADTGPGEIAAVAMHGDVAVCASAAGSVVALERGTGAPRAGRSTSHSSFTIMDLT